jgi:hypothetical protein
MKLHKLFKINESNKGSGFDIASHYASKLSSLGKRKEAKEFFKEAEINDFDFQYVLKLVSKL